MYLLFAGFTHYPAGGWNDFVEAYATLDDAREVAATGIPNKEWWHIVHNNKVVDADTR